MAALAQRAANAVARGGTASLAGPRRPWTDPVVRPPIAYNFWIEHPHFLSYVGDDEGVGVQARRWWGLGVLCVSIFISAVDTTIVNVALPDMSRDLGAGIGELQWVLDGFLVCLAGLLLVGSGLADRFGRRRVLLVGLSGFAVASVLAAVAATPAALIAARVLMGAAAACILPPALSLIAVMFAASERPRALALWAAVAGVGISVGPVAGGVLVPAAGWESVFLVNVPFAVVAVVGGIALLPESTRPGTPPLDLAGAGLSVMALVGIVFALIEGADAGWTSAEVLAAAAVGVLAGFVFARHELAVRSPLFDIRVLARPPVIAGAAALIAIYVAFVGVLFLLPQYLQYVQDRSVLASGLLLAPLGIGNVLTAPITQRLVRDHGPRLTMVAGLVAMAGAAGALWFVGNVASPALVLASVLLLGAALPLAIVPATAVIMDDLGEEQAGDGGAVNQLARQVGAALGVASIGTLFAVIFANEVRERLAVLPQALRARATESIEEAKTVLATAAGARGALAARADESFDLAARVGFAACAAVLLLAALLAFALGGPRR